MDIVKTCCFGMNRVNVNDDRFKLLAWLIELNEFVWFC